MQSHLFYLVGSLFKTLRVAKHITLIRVQARLRGSHHWLLFLNQHRPQHPLLTRMRLNHLLVHHSNLKRLSQRRLLVEHQPMDHPVEAVLHRKLLVNMAMGLLLPLQILSSQNNMEMLERGKTWWLFPHDSFAFRVSYLFTYPSILLAIHTQMPADLGQLPLLSVPHHREPPYQAL